MISRLNLVQTTGILMGGGGGVSQPGGYSCVPSFSVGKHHKLFYLYDGHFFAVGSASFIITVFYLSFEFLFSSFLKSLVITIVDRSHYRGFPITNHKTQQGIQISHTYRP